MIKLQTSWFITFKKNHYHLCNVQIKAELHLQTYIH